MVHTRCCNRRFVGTRVSWNAALVNARNVQFAKTDSSLGGGPQAHVHMEGMKCRVLYLNVLGMNALFCEPKATPAPYPYSSIAFVCVLATEEGHQSVTETFGIKSCF